MSDEFELPPQAFTNVINKGQFDKKIREDFDYRQWRRSYCMGDPNKKHTKDVCLHCNAPIRIHGGRWVHDDPDEELFDEFYGWIDCGAAGNFKVAEPRKNPSTTKPPCDNVTDG